MRGCRMKKNLLCVLLALAMSGEARASGYSDFNAGVAARNHSARDAPPGLLIVGLAAVMGQNHITASRPPST